MPQLASAGFVRSAYSSLIQTFETGEGDAATSIGGSVLSALSSPSRMPGLGYLPNVAREMDAKPRTAKRRLTDVHSSAGAFEHEPNEG